MQQRRQKRPQTSQQQMITKAVSHIRLGEANRGKLAALDELAQVYLALCQHYVTYFCTEALPDKFHPPVFKTPLSKRWQRVVIQQAAGIAQSWRTNRERAYQDYSDDLLEYTAPFMASLEAGKSVIGRNGDARPNCGPVSKRKACRNSPQPAARAGNA